MTNNLFSLKRVSKALGIKPYQVTYCLTAGHVPEPQNVGNRRLFSTQDIERLAEHFGVNIDHELLLEKQNYE